MKWRSRGASNFFEKMVDEYVTHWLGGGITSVGLYCCGWDFLESEW